MRKWNNWLYFIFWFVVGLLPMVLGCLYRASTPGHSPDDYGFAILYGVAFGFPLAIPLAAVALGVKLFLNGNATNVASGEASEQSETKTV